MAKKKPKPIGGGHYTLCRKCRGVGKTVDVKKANNPHGQALLTVDCPDCKDGTGISRGWVAAER